jgi:hypothetical protein
MTEFIGQHIGAIIIAFGIMGGMVLASLIFFKRDSITGVFFTREGFEIRTNDVSVWSGFVGEMDQIDSGTRKTIRRATTEMTILAPEVYQASTEAKLVVNEANQPLVYAAYENHHTREIAADGGDAYIADKANDVLKAVKSSREHFPGLDCDRAEAFVCHWFKKTVIPNSQKACLEKIALYSSLINSNSVSKPLKEIFAKGMEKNVHYIQCIIPITVENSVRFCKKRRVFSTFIQNFLEFPTAFGITNLQTEKI